MRPDMLNDPAAKASWSVIHAVGQEDLAVVDGLGSLVAPVKGKVEGIPVVLLIRKFVIAKEEHYLESKFGDEYRNYKQNVRRWI